MKAIYCENCGTITSPGPGNFQPRSCSCGEHRCWWVDGGRGIFRVERVGGHPSIPRTVPGGPFEGSRPKVWILGISNSLLHHQSEGTPTKEQVADMLEHIPDNYVFKKTMSNIIRIRPGQTSDTGWAEFEESKKAAGR